MDIFVFQMGKVASTSITCAINQQGLRAVQMHWLGRAQLIGSLDGTLLNVDIDDEVALRSTEQFVDNILYTRRLLWHRKHQGREGVQLKVITLTRDPISWYWGHLAENFDLYGKLILEWYNRQRSGASISEMDPALLTDAITAFHERLFEVMSRMPVPLDDGSEYERAARQLMPEVGSFMASQLMKLRLPTAWFDLHFEPNLDVSVYESRLTPQTGTAELRNSFAEVLVIRYENLDSAIEMLRGFTGCPQLELKRQNTTQEKPLLVDIKTIASEINPPKKMLDLFAATRYCRHFQYCTD